MSVAGDASWRAGGGVVEIQRERILDAVVEVVAERGVGAPVELVLARAKVSRGVFYECFDGIEGCLIAVMDGVLERVGVLAARAFEGEECWQDGMRLALAAVLAFFDREPGLTRVCIVETLAGAPVVREHRERVAGAFRALVVARIEHEVSPASPLAAEGVMASVMGIVYTRLVAREQGPLVELLGPLMGLASAPYLGGREVEREIEQGNELAREMLAERALRASEVAHGADVLVDVPAVLLSGRAQRARQCLLYVAQYPGVSNQRVAAGIGALHREQVSRLLGRLAGMGLLVKRAGGPGHPNAWSLTAEGEQVARSLTERQ